jgi:hypothetical protein
MNSWEGQMIAIALKELLEAFRALGRDGFGRKDRALLSAVIRDLLTVDPNITRAKATLKAIEALGARPSPDLYVAKNMLAAIQKTRLLEKSAARGIPLTSGKRPPSLVSKIHPPKTSPRRPKPKSAP